MRCSLRRYQLRAVKRRWAKREALSPSIELCQLKEKIRERWKPKCGRGVTKQLNICRAPCSNPSHLRCLTSQADPNEWETNIEHWHQWPTFDFLMISFARFPLRRISFSGHRNRPTASFWSHTNNARKNTLKKKNERREKQVAYRMMKKKLSITVLADLQFSAGSLSLCGTMFVFRKWFFLRSETF